jgi:chromosome partitioning protein
MYGVTDLMKHIAKIRRINPRLEVLGALLIKHDERLMVSKLIENMAREQISTSTKVNQAAMAQSSLHALDRTAKVSREFRQLAYELARELGLKGVAAEDGHA